MISAWADIQKHLRAEFPKLYVPGATPGMSPLLQHVKLTSADQSEGILLAINSFAYFETRYETFERYLEGFDRALGAFMNVADVPAATRFGLRYSNAIPPSPPAGDEAAPLSSFLKLRIEGLTPGRTVGQPELTIERAQGPLVLRLAIGVPPMVPAGVPFFVRGELPLATGTTFDLDCYQIDPGPLQAMPAFVHEAHRLIDEAFFSTITEEYLSYLQGEEADG
jgi:uncharacterized protein (TIGR04255 family)